MQAQALATSDLAQQQSIYLWNDLMTKSQAMEKTDDAQQQFGLMAGQYGERLPLEVCRSAAGFYLGTYTDRGPFTRESLEYWRKKEQAENALATGEWTQRYDV
ncbi:hypothetical protein AVME950_00405 [Acidovorax sp. SUPP950]|uniref:hypothetical protein n=1 Tax=Acidovorax sp. SUPP950 TaxID=511901 RepID=UPI0023BD453C|nr:hypothetical protein [Acidovorax sp. SUPP950]GKS73299.1 hypothetical protein AVME950_00405 [Acidovorax sp. SUPP950]